MSVNLPVGLIICTRNRADELGNLLVTLEGFELSPRQIIVVDSSQPDIAKRIQKLCSSSSLNVAYLSSLYGAPHQKNMGLDLLNELDPERSLICVSFLDDDVLPAPEYFSTVLDILANNPEVFCVGGFDQNLAKRPASQLRIALGIDSDKCNILLRNGLAIANKPSSELEICDWVPGGMQSFRRRAIDKERFDGTVRIHGDEVELQVRLQSQGFGLVATSSLLPVNHTSSQVGKTSKLISTSFLDGFRMSMARTYPRRFSKKRVVFSTAALALGELLLWVVHRRKDGLEVFAGHMLFFYKLMMGLEIVERVNHAGSGPKVKLNE